MLVIFIHAGLAWASPSQETDRTYFASAALEEVVGFEVVMSCMGKPNPPAISGKKTKFYVKQVSPCQNTDRPAKLACYLNDILTTCPADICDSELFDCGD